jgi:hypothetical protein
MLFQATLKQKNQSSDFANNEEEQEYLKQT